MFLFYVFLTYSKLKFSKINWLLPYKSPNYHINPSIILENEDNGCVHFESSSNDIKITHIYSDSRTCAKSAKFEVVTTGYERKSIIVLAKTDTESLELKIFLDKIHSLDFKSSTRSIYLEGSPVTFNLIARDDKHNTFDSLEGLQFNFTFDTSYLRKYTRKDNLIHHDSSISLIGSKIGKTSLTGEYYDKSCTIDLNVIEPIFLYPGPVLHVFPNITIPFKLCTMKGFSNNVSNRICEREIQYDSDIYNVQTDNSEILSHKGGFRARSGKIGITSIRVFDKRFEDNVATVIVNVQYPASVIQKDQYIILGNKPKFNPIFTANLQKRMDIFEPIPYYITYGEWKTLGTKKIGFKYMEYEWSANVIVCEPISIKPSNATLPVRYNNYFISVSGGSGRYSLKVSSTDLASLNGNHLSTYREGNLIITAIDNIIENHYANGYISISRIYSSIMETNYTELVTGSSNSIACKFYAFNQKPFSVDLDFEIISDRTDIIANKPMSKNYHLSTLNTGFVNLQCKHGEYISDKKLFSVISHLKANVEGLAAPKSSIPLAISNGPVQWPGSGTPNITVTCPGVEVKLIGRSFKVMEEFKGSCTVTSINPETHLNPNPIEMTATIPLEVVNIHNFSLHLVEHTAIDHYYCDTPSKTLDLRRPQKVLYYVNTVNHEIYTFARDIKNRIIIHHDYSIERLVINNNMLEGKFDYQTGHKHFNYRFLEDTQILLNGLVTQYYTVKIIKPLSIAKVPGLYAGEHSKVKIGITGGTTKYDLLESKSSVVFTNESLIIDANPGLHRYMVIDKCSNVNPTPAEVNIYIADYLDIIVNKTEIINREFNFKVVPKMQNTIIPSIFYDSIQVRVYPFENVTPDPKHPLHFRGIGTVPGKLKITATHRNLESSKEVLIIDKIDVQPRQIKILTGETEKLTKISGPDDLIFKYDEKDLFVSNFSVTALRSGKHNIIIRSSKYPELESVTIEVLVPKPLNLIIESDSQSYVQGGHLSLNVKVNTTMGIFIPSQVTWTIPNLLFENRIPHVVFANLTHPGLLDIHVQAFSLTKRMTIDVEEELKVDKSTIYLAPGTSIKLKYNVECRFEIFKGSIFNLTDNGLIQTSSLTGVAAVKVSYKSQYAIVVVYVELPNKITLMESIPGKLYLILLTRDGRHYDSYSGITFDVTGIDHTPFKVNYCSYDSNLYRNDTLITLLARSNYFSINNEQMLRYKGSIIPNSIILYAGARFNFTTNVYQPQWSVQSRLAHINKYGTFYSDNPGNYTIVCNKLHTAKAMVVKMQYIRSIIENSQEVRFEPVFENPNILFHDVIWPDDLDISCQCKTARVHPYRNSTGFFCIFDNPSNQHNELFFTVKSKKANIDFVSSNKKVTESHFGVPNTLYVKLSERRSVELPKLGIPIQELDIDSHIPQLTIKKSRDSISIATEKPFEDGTVDINHVSTGKQIIVHVSWDSNNSRFRTKLTLHYYIISGLALVLVFYILDIFTSKRD